MVTQQSIKFIVHGLTPFRVFYSRGVASGFKQSRVSFGNEGFRNWVASGAISVNFWISYMVASTGDHGVCGSRFGWSR